MSHLIRKRHLPLHLCWTPAETGIFFLVFCLRLFLTTGQLARCHDASIFAGVLLYSCQARNLHECCFLSQHSISHLQLSSSCLQTYHRHHSGSTQASLLPTPSRCCRAATAGSDPGARWRSSAAILQAAGAVSVAACAQHPTGAQCPTAWPSRASLQLGGDALWGCCGSCCARGGLLLAHHLQEHVWQQGAGLKGTLSRLGFASVFQGVLGQGWMVRVPVSCSPGGKIQQRAGAVRCA